MTGIRTFGTALVLAFYVSIAVFFKAFALIIPSSFTRSLFVAVNQALFFRIARSRERRMNGESFKCHFLLGDKIRDVELVVGKDIPVQLASRISENKTLYFRRFYLPNIDKYELFPVRHSLWDAFVGIEKKRHIMGEELPKVTVEQEKKLEKIALKDLVLRGLLSAQDYQLNC